MLLGGKWAGVVLTALIVVAVIGNWLRLNFVLGDHSFLPVSIAAVDGDLIVEIGWRGIRSGIYHPRDYGFPWSYALPVQSETIWQDGTLAFGGRPVLALWQWGLAVRVWIAAVIVCLPTAFLWWRERRRTRPGACFNCGYDLKGLSLQSVCPECGDARQHIFIRKRRTGFRSWTLCISKWAMAAVASAMLALTVMDWCGHAFIWGTSSLYFHGTFMEIREGQATFAAYSPSGFSGSPEASTAWRPEFQPRTRAIEWFHWSAWPWVIELPSWAAAVVAAAATAWLWRVDRRRCRTGRCGHCGYDRSGLLLNVVCPECGKAPEKPISAGSL